MADIDPAHVGRVQTFLMQKFMSYRKGEFEEFLVRFYNRGGYALLRPPMQTRWVDTETTPAEQQARQAFRRINRNAAEQRRYQEPWDGQQPPLLLPDGPQRALSRQQMRDVARRLTRQRESTFRPRACSQVQWVQLPADNMGLLRDRYPILQDDRLGYVKNKSASWTHWSGVHRRYTHLHHPLERLILG